MEKFRVFYLISGALFLLTALAGGAWWELSVGEPSKPLLYLGLSPFTLEVKMLESQVFEAPPFMEALFLAERGLAVLGATTIMAGALLRRKPWFRRLLNLRPLTTPVGFAIFVVLAMVLLPRYLVNIAPSLSQMAPNFAEALTPYSSGHLNVNLYPLVHIDCSLSFSLTSRFTIGFWIALLSGIMCLVGRILLNKEVRAAAIKAEPEAAPPPVSEKPTGEA